MTPSKQVARAHQSKPSGTLWTTGEHLCSMSDWHELQVLAPPSSLSRTYATQVRHINLFLRSSTKPWMLSGCYLNPPASADSSQRRRSLAVIDVQAPVSSPSSFFDPLLTFGYPVPTGQCPILMGVGSMSSDGYGEIWVWVQVHPNPTQRKC